MKSPLIQKPGQSVVQPQSSKTRAGNICFTIICWIITFTLWGYLGFITYYIYLTDDEDKDKAQLSSYGYSCLGIYILYLIVEFLSPTARYLIHKRSSEGIKAKMGELFKARPSIKFYAECYHYETVHYTEKNEDGEEVEKTRQEKVVTHRETEYFDYYSVRDISGLLNLNCDKAQIKRKCYIKLELKEEMNFADSISVADYEYQKDEFKDRNRRRDEYMDFSESWTLPGMTHHNLIKIGDYEPCTVNCFWYIIFTLFTLAQIYKWHVASFCIYQNYKIRKIMSTRYDLHSAEYDAQYSMFNPQINLITLKIDYEPAYYTYLNSSKKIKKPTDKELEKAKQYESKVPKYQIYTAADGDIQRTGTVKDNPDFVYDSYQAPKVEVKVPPMNNPNQYNQLNDINTNPPPGFNNPPLNNNIVPNQGKKKRKKQNKDQSYDSTAQNSNIINNNLNNNSQVSYSSGQAGGYDSSQAGMGGGIFSQGGGGIYSQPQVYLQQPGGNIYAQAQAQGGIYAQPAPGGFYAQPPQAGIYAQPPQVGIYSQPPPGGIYQKPQQPEPSLNDNIIQNGNEVKPPEEPKA